MTDNIVPNNQSPFDAIRHEDADGEFWLARELMSLLGYPRWNEFEDVVEKAKASCQNTGNSTLEHFSGLTLKTPGEPGRPKLDYRLSRYACYLTAQNGDPRKPEIAAAQSYFAIKTREAEVIEIQQPVQRVLPTRDAVDYIQAAKIITELPDGLLKQLVGDLLVDELSLQQNLKYLPVAEKPKQYTIVKIRAKTLGYPESQIGNGSALGKFVKARIQPAFAEQIGRYDSVNHYEITPALDQAITDYFEH
ncbi:MAG: BRO family protein [Microcoleus sp.]